MPPAAREPASRAARYLTASLRWIIASALRGWSSAPMSAESQLSVGLAEFQWYR